MKIDFRDRTGCEIVFKKKGNYTIDLRMESVSVVTPCYTNVGYETALWGGGWTDASNLSVLASQGVITDFGKEVVEGYLDWNGINNNVSLQPYVINYNDSYWDYDIYVSSLSFASGDTGGICYVYKMGPSNTIIEINDVITDTAPYVKAIVYISEDELGGIFGKSTITHEFGHALGLKHPDGLDKSIMQDELDTTSLVITDLDEHNLNLKY